MLLPVLLLLLLLMMMMMMMITIMMMRKWMTMTRMWMRVRTIVVRLGAESAVHWLSSSHLRMMRAPTTMPKPASKTLVPRPLAHSAYSNMRCVA